MHFSQLWSARSAITGGDFVSSYRQALRLDLLAGHRHFSPEHGSESRHQLPSLPPTRTATEPGVHCGVLGDLESPDSTLDRPDSVAVNEKGLGHKGHAGEGSVEGIQQRCD